MRLLRPGSLGTALGAAIGVACLAFATPAWATGNQLSDKPDKSASANNPQGGGNNPPGANGTVKIDDVPVDDGVDNDPHVSCNFAVKFFGFDKDQHANIIFTAHEPTGSGEELLRRDNVVVSTDAAGGAANDADKIFTFSASELGLDAYTPQKNQGYHIKLTVELLDTPKAGHHTDKHKVFWLQPCTATSNGGGGNNGGGNNGGGNNGGGNNGGGTGSESGGGTTPSASAQPSVQPSPSASTTVKLSGDSLPTTGTAVAGVVALGLVLVAAGGGTIALRRRALKFKA